MDPAAIVPILDASMANVEPLVVLAASMVDGVLTVTLTLLDDEHKPSDIKEQQLPALGAACLRHDAARVDAFLRACAAWLRSHLKNRGQPGWWLEPHDIFVASLLDDDRLRSFDDFAAVLLDPARRELAIARSELETFLARPELASVALDDEQLRALGALTPDGRSRNGVPGAVAGVKLLVGRGGDGRRALVSMMEAWADEEYAPWDTAWEGGPEISTLLLLGAWKLVDASLTGELRHRAIRAVDRVHRPLPSAVLARAGFGVAMPS